MGLLRIALWGVVAYVLLLFFRKLKSGRRGPGERAGRVGGPHAARRARQAADSFEEGRPLVSDPLSGVYVDPRVAVRREGAEGPLFFENRANAERYFQELESRKAANPRR